MIQCFSRCMKTNSFGLGFIVHLRASAQQKQNDRFLALFVRFRVLLPIQTGKISLFEGPVSYFRLLRQEEGNQEKRQNILPVQQKIQLIRFAGCFRFSRCKCLSHLFFQQAVLGCPAEKLQYKSDLPLPHEGRESAICSRATLRSPRRGTGTVGGGFSSFLTCPACVFRYFLDCLPRAVLKAV